LKLLSTSVRPKKKKKKKANAAAAAAEDDGDNATKEEVPSEVSAEASG